MEPVTLLVCFVLTSLNMTGKDSEACLAWAQHPAALHGKPGTGKNTWIFCCMSCACFLDMQELHFGQIDVCVLPALGWTTRWQDKLRERHQLNCHRVEHKDTSVCTEALHVWLGGLTLWQSGLVGTGYSLPGSWVVRKVHLWRHRHAPQA